MHTHIYTHIYAYTDTSLYICANAHMCLSMHTKVKTKTKTHDRHSNTQQHTARQRMVGACGRVQHMPFILSCCVLCSTRALHTYTHVQHVQHMPCIHTLIKLQVDRPYRSASSGQGWRYRIACMCALSLCLSTFSYASDASLCLCTRSFRCIAISVASDASQCLCT